MTELLWYPVAIIAVPLALWLVGRVIGWLLNDTDDELYIDDYE